MKNCWSFLLFLPGLWLAQWACAAQPALPVPPVTEPVVWTKLVNCALNNQTLRKTKGHDELPDATALSAQQLATNNYLEFVALETDKERYVGLSSNAADSSLNEQDYTLHLTAYKYRDGTVVEARERGVYKAEATYNANTVLRIAIENGAVKYYRNDEVFYTSAAPATLPLYPKAVLQHVGATISNAVIGKGAVPVGQPTAAAKPLAATLTARSADPLPALQAAANSPLAGIADDNKIYFPADYASFQPPPVGTRYADAVYGTKLVRLSDGWTESKDSVHHEYATMSPFSKDSRLILLQSEHGGFYVVDRSGKTVVPAAALVLGGSSEPRWSATNANQFYFHEGNQLRKYDVVTKQKTTVRSFPQFQKITFGGGEGDISEDGDHLMIVGDERHVAMYTLSTDTVGRSVDLTALGGWVEVYVTANNNVLVRWEQEGAGKYKGTGLFDRDMNFIRQVIPYGGHGDQARDTNGDEVVVLGAYRDTAPPPGCENNGVEKVRLSDSRKTCILPLNWDAEIHVSSNSNGSHPWVLVSVTDTGKGTAEANNKLPADWQRRWGVRFNELILVKVDGTERRRLAHHRSRTLDRYWWQPRATISKDGNFALFDSNFGQAPMVDYTDVFLVELKK